METDAYRILKLEQSLFHLEFMQDENYIRTILDADYMKIGKSGRIFTKDKIMASLLQETEDRKITMYNYTCTPLDEKIFKVHYITLDGEDQIMRTSLWKKENNAYVIVFHQASRMKEKAKLKETENLYAPIKLVRLDETYRRQLVEMMKEWREYNTTPGVNHSPNAIFRNDETDFEAYIHHLEHHQTTDQYVKDCVLFCYHQTDDAFIGAVNIRMELNEGLLYDGGNIGDGIRPSYRGKGYGTQMVHLALQECRKLGMKKVLMCCDHDNPASRATIMRNGGVLENMVISDDGGITERYWMGLFSESENISLK